MPNIDQAFSSAQCAQPKRGARENMICLFLWYPHGYAADEALVPIVEAVALVPELLRLDSCLRVRLEAAALSRLMLSLATHLRPEDANRIKALVLVDRDTPGLDDLPNVQLLPELIQQHQARWLEQLLETGRLTSHFQPIVHAQDTARIFGYEALLRAYDGDGNPVPPLRLFQCAKSANLVVRLDCDARETALEALQAHEITADVFINCNPSSILDPQACRRSLRHTLGDRADTRRIVLEIVEMEQVHDLPRFKELLAAYRREGFRIALDDIGSGYSSLNLIHHLRPDFVKLDMDLVRNVHADAYKAAITENVLTLTRKLGIQTIAEGVEQLNELAWLRQHGADFVQGYLIAKPSARPAQATPALATEPEGWTACLSQQPEAN